MKIKLSKFKKNDSDFLLRLRNNERIRKFFFNKNAINRENHNKWLNEFLLDKKNVGFIIKYTNKKVGFIKYDFNDFYYNISLGIDPEYQKKNITSKALFMSEKKLNKKFIISKIKTKNLISINFFIKNGYEILDKTKNYFILYKILTTNKNRKIFESINNIQNIRKRNNVNWMNILRIAFDRSPEQTKKVFKKIFLDDNLINIESKKLFS